MQAEIEAKFLNVDHEVLRSKLQSLGAVCEQTMILMRRALHDYPDSRFQKDGRNKRLRVRDQGSVVKINFKSKNKSNYSDEIETSVGSYNGICELLENIGLVKYSFQESKRETWKYKNVEIVLDEWPWLNTYIEIEGKTEDEIKSVAVELGFEWSDAGFGSVDTVYRYQYPGMKTSESIGDLAEVRFDMPIPDFLLERQTK